MVHEVRAPYAKERGTHTWNGFHSFWNTCNQLLHCYRIYSIKEQVHHSVTCAFPVQINTPHTLTASRTASWKSCANTCSILNSVQSQQSCFLYRNRASTCTPQCRRSSSGASAYPWRSCLACRQMFPRKNRCPYSEFIWRIRIGIGNKRFCRYMELIAQLVYGIYPSSHIFNAVSIFVRYTTFIHKSRIPLRNREIHLFTWLRLRHAAHSHKYLYIKNLISASPNRIPIPVGTITTHLLFCSVSIEHSLTLPIHHGETHKSLIEFVSWCCMYSLNSTRSCSKT